MIAALVLSALTASTIPKGSAPYFEAFCKSHHAGKFYTVIFMPNGNIADIGCEKSDFENLGNGKWKRFDRW